MQEPGLDLQHRNKQKSKHCQMRRELECYWEKHCRYFSERLKIELPYGPAPPLPSRAWWLETVRSWPGLNTEILLQTNTEPKQRLRRVLRHPCSQQEPPCAPAGEEWTAGSVVWALCCFKGQRCWQRLQHGWTMKLTEASLKHQTCMRFLEWTMTGQDSVNGGWGRGMKSSYYTNKHLLFSCPFEMEKNEVFYHIQTYFVLPQFKTKAFLSTALEFNDHVLLQSWCHLTSSFLMLCDKPL